MIGALCSRCSRGHRGPCGIPPSVMRGGKTQSETGFQVRSAPRGRGSRRNPLWERQADTLQGRIRELEKEMKGLPPDDQRVLTLDEMIVRLREEMFRST